MNKKFKLSPGAPSLVLIIVVLSMSIMGMLMFIRTQNDMRLSNRSMQVAKAEAQLKEQAEENFALLCDLTASLKAETTDDAAYLTAVQNALPDHMDMDERVIYWQEGDESRVLYAGVTLNPYEDDACITWHTRVIYAEVGNTWNEF